jgi:hypothetical protein
MLARSTLMAGVSYKALLLTSLIEQNPSWPIQVSQAEQIVHN